MKRFILRLEDLKHDSGDLSLVLLASLLKNGHQPLVDGVEERLDALVDAHSLEELK